MEISDIPKIEIAKELFNRYKSVGKTGVLYRIDRALKRPTFSEQGKRFIAFLN